MFFHWFSFCFNKRFDYFFLGNGQYPLDFFHVFRQTQIFEQQRLKRDSYSPLRMNGDQQPTIETTNDLEKYFKRPDIVEYLQIMDVADALRRQEHAVEKELRVDEQRAAIREHLKSTYAAMGEDVSDAQLDKAIEHYFSQMYAFPEHKKNLEYTLACWYVNRGRIARRVGLPLVGAAALTGMAYGAHLGHLRALEASAEHAVEQAYHQKTTLEAQVSSLASSPFVQQLPQNEAGELQDILTLSKKKLETSNAFFGEYCSEGTASDDITQANYTTAQQLVEPIAQDLQALIGEVDKGNKIIQRQQDIIATSQSLDALIGEIRNSTTSPVFRKQAEQLYANGKGNLAKRQLAEGVDCRDKLLQIKSDIGELSKLIPEVEKMYGAIKASAKETAAHEEGKRLYTLAHGYIETANKEKLSDVVKQLESLDSLLNQEYTMIITGGKWRYPNDNPSVKNYYLLVRAQDAEGNILEKDVKNEENGNIEAVREWGERVPEDVYEAVKNDKLDNGLIDNSLFGKKEKGYLNDEVAYLYQGKPLTRIGQITHW